MLNSLFKSNIKARVKYSKIYLEYTTLQKFKFTCCLRHWRSVLTFIKKSEHFSFDNNMDVNKILHLTIPSWRQNVKCMKIYYKKRQISNFLKNVNNYKNN